MLHFNSDMHVFPKYCNQAASLRFTKLERQCLIHCSCSLCSGSTHGTAAKIKMATPSSLDCIVIAQHQLNGDAKGVGALQQEPRESTQLKCSTRVMPLSSSRVPIPFYSRERANRERLSFRRGFRRPPLLRWPCAVGKGWGVESPDGFVYR